MAQSMMQDPNAMAQAQQMMQNPQMAQMAQNMMGDPAAMAQAQSMMSGMGGGGGAPGAGSGMPDLSAMMAAMGQPEESGDTFNADEAEDIN